MCIIIYKIKGIGKNLRKLSIISDQIKNNTYSYTGKGSFETVVNKYKNKIIIWLEELVPLQKQIDELNELENIEFQKRNYTRILTKLLEEPYKEFVSLNILVRDSSTITTYYQIQSDTALLYKNLIEDKFLKYPGKYDKYVELELFSKFLLMYKDDLFQTNDDFILSEPEVIQIESRIEPVQTHHIETNPIKKETNWTNLLLGKLK